MGAAKKLFKGAVGLAGDLVGGLMGGGKTPKPKVSAMAPTASAADVAAKEEEDRRKRLLALNAGGNRGQLTGAGGDTSTPSLARKTLMGQ